MLWRNYRTIRTGLVILVLLCAAEAAVQFRAYRRHGAAGPADASVYQPHPRYGKRPRAGLVLEAGGKTLRINQQGFRGPDLVAPSGEAPLRIACVGDSVVFGRYIDDDALFTARLAVLLEERLGREVEVINAGVPGYSLDTTFAVLREEIAPLEPDAVVVAQVVNDLNGRCLEVFAPSGSESSGPAGFDGYVGRWLGTWRDRHVLLQSLVRKNLTPWVAPLSAGSQRRDDVPEDFARPYQRKLTELVEWAKRRDLPVVLCTAWKAFGDDQAPEQQFQAASGMLLNNPYLSLRGALAAYDAFNEAVRTVAREHSVVLVDMAAVIPTEGEYFRDTVHLTARGHALAAEALAEAIAPRLDHSGGDAATR